MANKILDTLLDLKVPVELQNTQKLRAIREALGYFGDLDEKSVYKAGFSDKKSGYTFKNYNDLRSFLTSPIVGFPTNTPDKYFGIVVENWYENLTQKPTYEQDDQTQIPEYKEQTQTTFSETELKGKIEQAEERLKQKEEIKQRQAETIQAGIKRQQELYEQAQQQLKQNIADAQKVSPDLKGKVLYATITIPEKPALNEDEKKDFDKFKLLSQKDPIEAAKQFQQIIETKIDPDLKNRLSEEELKLTIENAAADIVSKFNPKPEDTVSVPVYAQTAILNSLSRDDTTINSVVQSQDANIALKNSLDVLQKNNTSDQLNRLVTENILGKKFAIYLYGPEWNQVQIAFHQSRVDGSTPINLEALHNDAINLQQRQSNTLEYLKDFSVDQAQPILINNARAYIQQKIATLPVNSKIKVLYNSEIGNLLFSRYGLATPLTYEAISPLGSALMKTGLGPYASAVGHVTGWNFGVQVSAKVVPLIFSSQGAVTTAGVAAYESATWAGTSFAYSTSTMAGASVAGGVATQTAAKAGAVGLVAKVLGLFGITSGVATFGITTALTLIGGAIAKKVAENLPRIKQWIQDNAPTLAIISGLGAFFATGPLRAVLAVPAIAFGAVALTTGGLAAVGTGIAGVWTILTSIGGLIAIEIATPVIVTLISLPILVAFIMFVINSGAYIVPPSPVSDSAFGEDGSFPITCTEEKTPVAFGNNTTSPIASRAWSIASDLYQGFWCFWNRSPGDLPTDTIKYKPSYPELFDMDKFKRNPNPTREEVSNCGECLFWCTWIVQKAYKENGNKILYTLWSPAMQADFTARGKFIPSNQVTPTKALPGSVIFFDVNNSLARTDHVGVAHTVTGDGIQFVQSNAGTKDGFIPFNSNGTGLQNIPGIKVLGIGLP